MNRTAPPTPRRIALVTSGFDLGGGVPRVARWLRDGLRSLGYTVDVHDLATSRHDPCSRSLLAPRSWMRSSLRDCPTSEDSTIHWGANAVEVEVMRYQPRRELTEALRGYDVIQVVAGSPAWGAAVIGAGAPVVLQVASLVTWERKWRRAEESGPLGIWRRGMTLLTSRVENQIIRDANMVLVENAAMFDYIRSRGQHHVIKAPPGVDTKFFSPLRTGWRRDGHLLAVARLDDTRKGLAQLIEAYAHIVRREESIPPLVLCGKGQLPSPLIDLIMQRALSSRVIIRSDVSDEALRALYRDASIFVLTSHEEGLCMAVLEAMSCGLPVVCTDTAGTRETVVDGATGWLVAQADRSAVPREIADRVIAVLHGDGGFMGARGRERCEDAFSTAVALRRFTDVYAQLARGAAFKA
jgi:glycosyltransferase involved in cell wall biosynthesis